MTGPLPFPLRLAFLLLAGLLTVRARRTPFLADRIVYLVGAEFCAALVLADLILWW